MTLSESLALYDGGHLLYHKTYVDYNSLLSVRNKKKLAANLIKRSSLNVQAQIVSKQTYLHQKTKKKKKKKEIGGKTK